MSKWTIEEVLDEIQKVAEWGHELKGEINPDDPKLEQSVLPGIILALAAEVILYGFKNGNSIIRDFLMQGVFTLSTLTKLLVATAKDTLLQETDINKILKELKVSDEMKDLIKNNVLFPEWTNAQGGNA